METCKYDLTELPEGVVALTETNRPDKTVLKWSGAFPIPAIGTAVKVTMNKLGSGVVESYFYEHGYLGVCVKLSEQPEWHRKQSVGTRWPHSALVFGQEISVVQQLITTASHNSYRYEVLVVGRKERPQVVASSLEEARKIAKQQYGIIRHVRCISPKANALRP